MKYGMLVFFLAFFSSSAEARFWCYGWKCSRPIYKLPIYQPPKAQTPKTCSSCQATGPLTELVPLKFRLTAEHFDISYNKQECGELLVTLNQDDDLQFDFKRFNLTAYSVAERWCRISVKVNLPSQLAMGASGIALEGQYEYDNGGVSVFSQFSLNGASPVSILEEYNGQPGRYWDTFLLREHVIPQQVSSCNGPAEFEFAIKLMGVSGESGAQVAVGIARAIAKFDFTEVGIVQARC